MAKLNSLSHHNHLTDPALSCKRRLDTHHLPLLPTRICHPTLGQWVVPLHFGIYTMKNFITEPQSSDTVSQGAQIKTCLRSSDVWMLWNTPMSLSNQRFCKLYWYYYLKKIQGIFFFVLFCDVFIKRLQPNPFFFFLAAFCHQQCVKGVNTMVVL